MIKIIGERRSGKTTELLKLAHENHYVLIEPTYAMAMFAKDYAKKLGFEDVKIICAHNFQYYHPGHREESYLIDELDLFLKVFNIAGYSDTKEETDV